jgi:hypothetical protein
MGAVEMPVTWVRGGRHRLKQGPFGAVQPATQPWLPGQVIEHAPGGPAEQVAADEVKDGSARNISAPRIDARTFIGVLLDPMG